MSSTTAPPASAGDDPAHKAMLFFLEVLMNSNGPLTISQLAGRFGSRSFSTEMRSACGGNEAGLRKFLLKYPSLFQLRGGVVSLFDGRQAASSPTPSTGSGRSTPPDSHSRSSSVSGSSAPAGPSSGGSPPAVGGAGRRATTASNGVTLRPLPDVTTEMAAVQFFQGKLARRGLGVEAGWMPVRSLAGHLSQATSDIRAIVGPQLEFRSWLIRHPHIFVVQGDAVRLQDGIEALVSGGHHHAVGGRPLSMDISLLAPPKPQLPPARRSPPSSLFGGLQRSRSLGEKMAHFVFGGSFDSSDLPSANVGGGSTTSLTTLSSTATPSGLKKTPALQQQLGVSANEYKALMYLKEVLEKNGPLKIHSLSSHLSKAPEATQNAVGWTRMEMEDFLRKHPNIFVVSPEDIVSLCPVKPASSSSSATGNNGYGSQSQVQQVGVSGRGGGRTLCSQGKIYHVAKLWGIIDLGKHEHVFFDRSIMRHAIDDLQKEFRVGETLCFSAVLAPKTSRSKWRAELVWKEHEQRPASTSSFSSLMSEGAHASTIEDEINRFLPNADDDGDDGSEELLDGWIESPVTGADPATPSSPTRPPLTSKLNGNGDEGTNLEILLENRSVVGSAVGFKANEGGGSSGNGNGRGERKDDSAGKAGAPSALANGGKKFADACCQTISTGSIISTQFFHEP